MTAVLGALDGVRIVDLTQMLAGPFCTMLLADQGAEVIKIEPLDGDHTRIVGPYHDDDKLKAFGGYFASVNRNKKSVAVDLKPRPVGGGERSRGVGDGPARGLAFGDRLQHVLVWGQQRGQRRFAVRGHGGRRLRDLRRRPGR